MIRLAFVGPMIGRNQGYVTTQGEILSDLFKNEGYPVISVSYHVNRYNRLADIISTLIRQRNKIDIQCLQVYSGPSFVVGDIASWLGRLLGQRVVMVLRGGAMPQFMARFPHWSCRVLRRADALVTPSPFLAKELVRYGFKAKIIPNVVNISAYPYRYRRHLTPRLFWMRKFHPIYNPEMAVRVLARVRKVVPDTVMVMAGHDSGTQADVKYLAHNLDLDDAVRFQGFLDMAAKIEQGNAADIFLNTNRVDNMPVSVIEACALGLPVVATNVGGIPDLLTDGETSLLVPDNDDQKMSDAVLSLLRDPELARRLSINGRKLAEHSAWEQVRPQWEQLFANVMGLPARRGDKIE
jgi:L-malate glycosyltransferase